MKYRFITILHNMKLDSIKNKGIGIFKGARISNSSEVLKETLDTTVMKTTLGVHSKDEFDNKVYFYINGEFEDIDTKEQFDEIGNQYAFLFLRQAQQFGHHLWEVKDNNVYVRDGFLLGYNKRFEDGFTFKASLSETFSYASLERISSKFSDAEIQSAIQDFVPTTIDDYGVQSLGGKYPDSNHFFKARGSNRLDRAEYFTVVARSNSILPMKIVNYCNALECLFTVGKSEVNHKIAERVAGILGTSKESKKILFKLIKNAYNYRSSLVHGQHIKGSDEELASISVGLDDVIRKLFNERHKVFTENDNEMEIFFLDLLFSDNN